VDDFWSGSRAAIAGGITTIGNMTYPMPDEEGAEETPNAAVTREMAGAAPEAAVDWFLHPILLRPAALPEGEVAALAGSGHASIKMFLSDPDLAADEPALLAAASAAKAAGSLTLLHCEDGRDTQAGRRAADRGGPRRGRELPGRPPGRRRGNSSRPGHRHRPPHRRARLHRAPVILRRP
jgi:dihydroorotase-like cyclic amidohydrolase